MSRALAFATAVCPSAAFLVPARALAALRPGPGCMYASTKAAHTQHQSQFRLRTKKHGVTRLAFRKIRTSDLDKSDAQLYSYFNENLVAHRIDDAMVQYKLLVPRGAFEGENTFTLCRGIHNAWRASHASDAQKSELLTHARQVLSDIRAGIIPPRPGAHMHLISLFKDAGLYDEGRQMWRWLVKKDGEFVDPQCYGAAIELFADEGKTDLPQLERMYTSALRRFPGTFVEYHFSPEAMVPHRGQRGQAVRLPFTLLQGIMTARISLGEWRRAYLALDTVLRILPEFGCPTRVFALLIYKRPASQSYKAFMMACRSGYLVQEKTMVELLNRLTAGNDPPNLHYGAAALTRVVTCMRAYHGAGGSIHGSALSTMIRCLMNILPIKLYQRSKPTRMQSAIAEAAFKAMLKLIKAGVRTSKHTHTGLIALAGIARRPDYLGEAIKDSLEFMPAADPALRGARIIAAGRIGHRELLEASWENAVEQTNGAPEARDWYHLTQACLAADYNEYLEKQKKMLPSYSALSEDHKHKLAQRLLYKPHTEYATNYAQGNPADLEPLLKEAMSEVDKLAETMEEGGRRNFYEDPVQIRSQAPLASEEDLRQVYDELTTDPNAPPDPSEAAPEKTATGYPLDELRFQNWVDMTELIADSEAEEAFAAREKLMAEKPDADPESIHDADPTRPARPITDLDVLRKEVRRLRAYGQYQQQLMEEEETDDQLV